MLLGLRIFFIWDNSSLDIYLLMEWWILRLEHVNFLLHVLELCLSLHSEPVSAHSVLLQSIELIKKNRAWRHIPFFFFRLFLDGGGGTILLCLCGFFVLSKGLKRFMWILDDKTKWLIFIKSTLSYLYSHGFFINLILGFQL